MKNTVLFAFGSIGGWIAMAFGGWSAALTTLIIFMIIDYITGIVVAGVFHKSKKSDNGTLKSTEGWKGLYKKGMTLLIVLVACRLDIIIGTSYIKDACVIMFVANETLSIIENAGLMGIPIPKVITQAIDLLNQKGEPDEHNIQ